MKSSPDTEEIPDFTEEVESAIKRMKRYKAHGMDWITSDVIKLGRQIVFTYLTNIFNIPKTKQIPDSWHEAKVVGLKGEKTSGTIGL